MRPDGGCYERHLTWTLPLTKSIGRQSDARCVVCKNVDSDAWEPLDSGLALHVCLACKTCWHLECLPEDEDRELLGR